MGTIQGRGGSVMIWALGILAGFLAVVPVALATGTLLSDQVRLQDAMSNAAAAADATHLSNQWSYLAMVRQDLGSAPCHLLSFRIVQGHIEATTVMPVMLALWGHTVNIPITASVG